MDHIDRLRSSLASSSLVTVTLWNLCAVIMIGEFYADES